MRRTLGWILFIVGLIVLGWWARGHQAEEIQAEITDEANNLTASLNDTIPSANLQATVSGRDINVSGTLPEGQAETVLEQYSDLKGRRVVRSEFNEIQTMSPYTFNVTKSDAGVQAMGYADSQASTDELTGLFDGASQTDIQLAAGAPANWSAAVTAGTNALETLDSGELSISDQTISLTGAAPNGDVRAQAESILNDLPEGYTKEVSISAPVEGPDFAAEFDVTKGLMISGHSTEDGTDQRIAEDLGAPIVESTLVNENSGNIENVEPRMQAIAEYLPRFDQANVQVKGDNVNFTGYATRTALTDDEKAAFKANFSEGDSVEILDSIPDEGTERQNILNGETEYYYDERGNWGEKIEPVVVVEPEPEPAPAAVPASDDCDTRFVTLLEGQSVNFVTGSAEIDGSSVALLDQMADLTNQCLEAGNMKLEIGGYTDSDGDEAANLALSQARAEAVLNALSDRGVDVTNVVAVGYGEADPIASNDTPEGKAANRRTTFTWQETN